MSFESGLIGIGLALMSALTLQPSTPIPAMAPMQWQPGSADRFKGAHQHGQDGLIPTGFLRNAPPKGNRPEKAVRS